MGNDKIMDVLLLRDATISNWISALIFKALVINDSIWRMSGG